MSWRGAATTCIQNEDIICSTVTPFNQRKKVATESWGDVGGRAPGVPQLALPATLLKCTRNFRVHSNTLKVWPDLGCRRIRVSKKLAHIRQTTPSCRRPIRRLRTYFVIQLGVPQDAGTPTGALLKDDRAWCSFTSCNLLFECAVPALSEFSQALTSAKFEPHRAQVYPLPRIFLKSSNKRMAGGTLVQATSHFVLKYCGIF